MDTWDRLDAKTEEAGKLADATGRDQVKDTKTLDALGKLADAKPAKPREQCTAAMDTKTLGDTRRQTRGRDDDLQAGHRPARPDHGRRGEKQTRQGHRPGATLV
jgi:hypothetical protein